MARTLPWLADTTNRTAHKSAQRATVKRKRRDLDEDASVTPSTSFTRSRPSSPARRAYQRSHSTSPPPAPPPTEYMKSSDGVWIMVEDELYAMAQQFTQHLHHAEYKRLQKEAAERNQQILLPRPVDERAQLSVESQIIRKVETHRKRVSEIASSLSTRKVASEEDDSEAEVAISDRHLASLMHGTGGGNTHDRVILQDGKRASASRAAAGFTKQSLSPIRNRSSKVYDIPGPSSVPTTTLHSHAVNNDFTGSEEDDGDLDLMDSKPTLASKAVQSQTQNALRQHQIVKIVKTPILDTQGTNKTHVSRATPTPSKILPQTLAPETSLDEDFFPRKKVSVLPHRRPRPNPAKAKATVSEVSEIIKLEEIPTFLF